MSSAVTAPAHLCPLCGHAFAASAGCTAGCPMSRRCSLLRCPNCRYQFPERSRLYDALRRLLAWVGGRLCPSPASDADSLANLAPGSTAVVVRLDPAPTDRSQRLADLGLVPGASVRLLQRHPAYVIEVGETTLAIELAVARSIAVRVAE